ncbi:MAG: hypothetical protein HY900_37225 [Deltaproteobacteria bacterium]|nr:hypothetical protein [Deltaproteobacteria bacterium]
MRLVLLLPAFVLLLLGCAPAVVEGPRETRRSPRESTSEELIAEARARGEIDDQTALLYRVLAAKDSSKLPPRYLGSRPARDGTLALREARLRFPELRPDVQEALRPYLFPEARP